MPIGTEEFLKFQPAIWDFTFHIYEAVLIDYPAVRPADRQIIDREHYVVWAETILSNCLPADHDIAVRNSIRSRCSLRADHATRGHKELVLLICLRL